MSEVISATEYSKRRGVTPTTIATAIAEGRLKNSVRRHGKGYLIDPELADAELARNNATGGWGGKRKKGEKVKPADAAGPFPDIGEGETYNDARTRHERLKADLAALDLAEKEGRLVEAAAVEREAFRVARLVRDAMLNIPDRVAGELAAESDPFRVVQLLTLEIRKALEGLKV